MHFKRCLKLKGRWRELSQHISDYSARVAIYSIVANQTKVVFRFKVYHINIWSLMLRSVECCWWGRWTSLNVATTPSMHWFIGIRCVRNFRWKCLASSGRDLSERSAYIHFTIWCCRIRQIRGTFIIVFLSEFLSLPQMWTVCESGPHEKRLLHQLLDAYNVLERPVVNESDPLQLSFGLTLMQIIDVVSDIDCIRMIDSAHFGRNLLTCITCIYLCICWCSYISSIWCDA